MKIKGSSIWQKLRWLIRLLLPIERFDLFLQGALLILTLYDGYAYLLLRRSAAAAYFSPAVEDWVYMGAATSELLFGAALAWFGRKRRHLALSGWLLAASVVGLLVLAFPQPFIPVPVVELCGGTSISPSPEPQPSSETLTWLRTTLIILQAILCSLARISIWAHGITYLDDHEPHNGAYYYGILISIRVSVGVNARTWFATHSLSENWWKGQLSFAMLTLMFSVLFTLFPKRYPSWKRLEVNGDIGFFSSVLRILSNKVVMIQTLALSFITAGVWGFVHYERDYVRTRYHFESAPDWSEGRTTRLAGDILRTFVIVFFVAVFRARFSGRRPDGVKATTASKVGAAVAVLAAIFFVVLAVLKCDNSDVVGLTREYQQPECSQSCGCNSERYEFAPVCTLDTLSTYFSPCHAGCSDFEDLNGFFIFNNCTCSGSARALRGACDVVSCQTYFAVYQIIYVNALALSAASMLMQGMALLRAVEWTDKPVVVGIAFGIVAFIADVPGHLLYMFISDVNCAYKHEGTCLLHTGGYPEWLSGISAALLLCSAVATVIAFIVNRNQVKTSDL